jgi:16S rRNA (adenine1518-N6/adenine1519-N6)-dimethyltransferase
LQSDKALNSIVAAADLSRSDKTLGKIGDRVLEIGPGKGVLTQQLVAKSDAVIAVEIDRDLCQYLAQKLGSIENFLLLQGDFLSLDIEQLLQPFPSFHTPNKVVANIPYNITGPILEKLLGTIAQPASTPYQSIVLLIQKEVAQRLTANPSSRNFGALSVRVQYLADCTWICDVPAKAFYPPPKVDSAVVRLRPRPFPIAVDRPKHMETLVKVGFSNKRKMLRNNLQSLIERDVLTRCLEELNIDPQARAEALSVTQWVSLSNKL